MFKKKVLFRLLAISLSLSLIAGCGGRAANPTVAYKVSDGSMSCEEIKAEMAHIQSQVDKLIPESNKTAKNVGLGVAGWFFLVPWFFMDFSEAEKVEIKAYQERYLSIEKLYSRNGCEDKKGVTEAKSSNGVDTDPRERLRALKELLEQGLISTEEYKKLRLDIIEGI